MAETNSAAIGKSPEGSAAGEETSGAKGPAVKDKQCQYCHQAFTSSSLGRHLDQYLFKKKPDGIHDVEEIRRLRSSITRRQARASSGRRDSPDVGGGKGGTESPGVAAQDPGSRSQEGGARFLFNTPTWHSTGVINDIPDPSASHQGTRSSLLPVSQSQTMSTGPLDFANRGASTNLPDTARALELALREVLDNIKAATSRTRPRLSPFDFEVQAQTFPALCLHMLPPPPSLFATHPFPTTSSFPLEPPGVSQVEVVRHALHAHIDRWRTDQLASTLPSQSGSTKDNAINHDPGTINRTAHQYEEIGSRHLDLAYQHWMVLPPETKRETWQLELTRAFAREAEKRKELDAQLSRVQQEANQLRAQVERLESCQWPREFAIFPPDMLPLSRDAARELEAKESSIVNAGSSRWDYDNVVTKWKRVVMHDKSMGRVGVGYANLLEDAVDSNRSKAAADPGPDTSSGTTTYGHASTFGTHNQQNSSYQPHDLHRNAFNGPGPHPQAKRQRLMNGAYGTRDNNNNHTTTNASSEGNSHHHQQHPLTIGTSTAASANGAGPSTTAWIPNSVQSLLVSNATSAQSASTSTSTAPPL